MLRKTILKINRDLNKEDQIAEMCNNISAALEEIQNYKINYILYVENLSIEQKQEAVEDIKESLLEIADFISNKEKKDDEVMLIMQENFKKAKGDRNIYLDLMEQYWSSKKVKQIRRFVKDYVVEDEITGNKMIRGLKDDYISISNIETEGKRIIIKFDMLDPNQKKYDTVNAEFNTSTFTNFWNSTTEAEEK